MAVKHPVVRRDEKIRSALIGVYVIVLIATIGLSERPIPIGNSPWVMPGTPIPKGSGRVGIATMLDDYGVHIPKFAHVPLLVQRAGLTPVAAAPNAADAALAFGYSIVETDILGLPFWFRTDEGHVIYYETPGDYVTVEASDYNLKATGILATTPLASQRFAWWEHLWGWLFVVAAGGTALFELGALRRRREAEGLI